MFRQPDILAQGAYWMLWTAFMGNAALRLAACIVPARGTEGHAASHLASTVASNENLPTYSVIVALYREAKIVPQILRAMQALRYPRDRIEILFALEACDQETIDAFGAFDLAPYIRIIEVPDGFPRTKPRALNFALAQACGDLVVIYDAEDHPHPDQLLSATAAFAAGPARLSCLQAPLRPVGGSGFIARQFTFEYAVQFDVLLPALQAFGLPFPLGGTSNHFKAEVLKAIGGWDAYNVTEDADLGLRLAQFGYSSGLLTTPTYEAPPSSAFTWIPQRTRWIKGYMQTLLVHTRLSTMLRPRVLLSLLLGVALSAAAAVCYAPFTILLLMSLLLIGVQMLNDPGAGFAAVPFRDLALFATGTVSAMLTLAVGARRAGLRLTLSDILAAPAYWCLQSAAAGFALYQLITRPFHWDKTDHAPCETEHQADKSLYDGSASEYGQSHDHHGFRHHLAHNRLG